MASTPYQAYTGDLTAPINAQQNTGISGINANAGYANPYIQQASNQAASSTAPIDASTIQQYQNPYTQQVIDATTAQMRHDNATAQAGLTGNQIAQGALGGNATGVARGVLAGQQGRTMASTVAGLYDQSYKQALQAAQQQQQTGLAGANAQANYGISGQNAALTGATAQLGAGSLMQQNEQARLNALYQQYQQQQAYPYQQTQWLAGIGTGVGSNLGGTSSGQTTGPAPNSTGQWLGAGLSAASLFLSDRRAKEDIQRVGEMDDGTTIYRYRYKGSPEWHIGPMAQEVDQDHVVKGVDGMRYMDLKGVTDDVVERAEGGGVFGDYDPVGVAAGQQFAQASPWQMRPNGNGTVSVLNVRTGQIIYTGSPSGAASAQANAPRGRAAGGGVGVSPWSEGVGWIPQMQIHGGSGAPRGSAPSLQDPSKGQGDPAKLAQGIVGVGKGLSGLDWGGAYDAGLGNLSGDSWGGGSFWKGDTYGGSSASPLPGLSAADYGAGFAAGGGVAGYVDPEEARYREGDEFRTMMNDPDPMGEANRMNAHDALRRGDGIVVPSELPVFGENGRMMGNQTSIQGQPPAPPAAPVVAEEEEPANPPTDASARSRGVSGPPAPYYAAPDAVSQPEPRGGGFGLGLLSPNAQTGLLAAGLGMLSSRSPFLGNVVGEGGQQGLAAYGAAEEKDRQIASEAQKLAREARRDFIKDALEGRKQTESERHNRATEGISTKNLDRTKFVPAGQYMGEDGIYRPVAMDSSTGRLVDMSSGKEMPSGAKYEGKGSKDSGFSEEDAMNIARRYVKGGDKTVLQGLGTSGAAKIKVNRAIDKVMKEENISPEEMSQRVIEFEGRKSGSRTLGTMEAKMGAAAFEAEGAMKLARGVIERLPRTSFLPFNRLIEGYSKNTLNPDQAELYARVQAIVNTYSAVMSRGANVTTDSSRHHAAELLNTAADPKTFNRVLDTMQNEIDMAKQSPAKMHEYYRKLYGPKAVEEGRGAAGGPPPAGAPQQFKPPPGALARTYNNKVYYYDPNTKQPYPGQ